MTVNSSRGLAQGRAGFVSWALASALFLGLFGAYGSVWEPAHDEGVTFTQVMGPMGFESCETGGVAVAEATAWTEPRASHGYRDVVAALQSDGMHPPAYYLALHAAARIAGTDRLSLSGLLALLGLVSIFSIGRISSRMAPGLYSGTAAMLLLAASPWFVGYSVFLRPYGMALAIGLVTTWLVLEIHAPSVSEGRQLLLRVGFVVLSGLGLYTLYHYAFVLAWQMLGLLVFAWNREPRRRYLVAWVAMGSGIVLVFAPWIPRLVSHLAASTSLDYYFVGWPTSGDWLPGLGHLLLVFALGEGLWSTWAGALRLAAVLLGVITLPCILISLRSGPMRNLDPISRVLWLMLPVLPAMILASDWVRDTHTILLSKTNFMFLPVGILLIVRSAYAFSSRRGSLAMVLAWSAIFFSATVSAFYTRSWALTPAEVVAETIRRADSSAHMVLLSSDARGYVVPLLRTLRDTGVGQARLVHAPVEELERCLAAALASPDIHRVTLVDWKVPYRDASTLGPPRLRRMAESAQAAGWSPIRIQPSQARIASVSALDRWWRQHIESVGADQKLLLLASPTKGKYFSE